MKKADETQETILVVEDSPTQILEIEYLLTKAGYGVILAEDGRQGLTAARKNLPSLIISDIIMPVMNGYEMCRELNLDPELSKIPVILLTSLSDVRDIVKGIEARADYYVTKPLDEKYLLARVADVIDRKRISKNGDPSSGLSIIIDGRQLPIKAQPQQILNLLVSTYENSLHQNQNLIKMQKELKYSNEALEQKLYEIQNSEERFESLVRTIPDIVYKIDTSGNFLFLNEAVNALGYQPQELIGRHFSCIIKNAEATSRDHVLPGYRGMKTDPVKAPKLFDERRTGNRMTKGLEVHLLVKGGAKTTPGMLEPIGKGLVVVELNSSGVYEHKHNVKEKIFVATVGVIRDITERKKIEKELRRLSSELISKEKLAMLGKLVGSVNHELRNPLGVISNAVYFLKNHLKDIDSKTDRHLDILQRELNVCTRLIADFLDLANINKSPSMEEASLENVLQSALEVIKIPANIDFKILLEKNLPKIYVDAGQIRRVFMNLISNAVQAMTSGGKLMVKAVPMADYCEVTVSDTGVGIPRENLEKIFESLFTTKAKGIGMGLSIVKDIIEKHNGAIQVESKEGTGTSFTFTLPIRKREKYVAKD